MATYISGPMTGWVDDNCPAFYKLAAELRKRGVDVVSPAENPGGLSYPEYLLIAFGAIRCCRSMHFLEGWETSPGACMEFIWLWKLWSDSPEIPSSLPRGPWKIELVAPGTAIVVPPVKATTYVGIGVVLMQAIRAARKCGVEVVVGKKSIDFDLAPNGSLLVLQTLKSIAAEIRLHCVNSVEVIGHDAVIG